MSRSVGPHNGNRRPTYSVVLARAVPLIVEGLLVDLLHVPVGVAVHLDTVGCWRDAMVRAEDLVWCLGEDRCAGLELRHAIVEEVGIHVRLGHAVGPHISLRLLRAGCAVSMCLANLRGELVVDVVLVERVSHTAILRPAMAEGDVVEVREVEVVEVVKVDQIAEILVGRSVHARPRLRICTVHCVRRAPAGGGAASGQVGRVSIYEARAIFFGLAGGAVVRLGWDRGRSKDARRAPSSEQSGCLVRFSAREGRGDYSDCSRRPKRPCMPQEGYANAG